MNKLFYFALGGVTAIGSILVYQAVARQGKDSRNLPPGPRRPSKGAPPVADPMLVKERPLAPERSAELATTPKSNAPLVERPISQPVVGNEYIHLSFLEPYLRKYRLNPEVDGSFFELLTHCRNSGKRYFIDKLQTLLSEDAGAAGWLAAYRALQSEKIDNALLPGVEKASSPKVYLSGFQNRLARHGLTAEAVNDLRKAVIDLLRAEYNGGKDQLVTDFSVNFKWLDKYLQEGSIENVAAEMQSIALKLAEAEI